MTSRPLFGQLSKATYMQLYWIFLTSESSILAKQQFPLQTPVCKMVNELIRMRTNLKYYEVEV